MRLYEVSKITWQRKSDFYIFKKYLQSPNKMSDTKKQIQATWEIMLYQDPNGQTEINVTFENDTVRLSQEQMAKLFGKAKSTINEHIKNIYKEWELIESETMIKFGNSEFAKKPVYYYNLDTIISLWYRVNSKRWTQFRIRATQKHIVNRNIMDITNSYLVFYYLTNPMKKIFWITSMFVLLLLTGCTTIPSQTNNTWDVIDNTWEIIIENSMDYSGELIVAWIGPDISFEQTIAPDALALKKTFEDHSDHVYFSRQIYSNYLDIQEDLIPWNHIKFIGKVRALDAAAGNRYYEVVSIDELIKIWNPNKEEVTNLLTQYGYCEEDADCVAIYGKCPLPCHISVNTKFSWTVDSIINNFRDNQDPQCTFKCMEIKKVECIDYKCKIQ